MRGKNDGVHIGEIYYMRFIGSACEQNGWRPGIVFQNNVGNQHSPNIIALPLTSKIKKASQPTHVVLPASATGLRETSMVLCENPERMSKDRIGEYVTTLSEEDMARVVIAYLLASSAISYLEPELLLHIWQKAILLNGAA